MMRMLVGFDGSAGGRDALALARTLGRPSGSKALVVVVLPYGPLPVDFDSLENETAEIAAPLLERARKELDGLEVETRSFGGGSPAQVLTSVAEGEASDAIVVGSPHRGLVGRALIGSVAENLLHGSPCAVVVAPRAYAGLPCEPFRQIAVGFDGTPEAEAALRRAEAIAADTDAVLRIFTVIAPPVAIPGLVGYAPTEPPDPDRVLTEAVNSVDERLAARGQLLDGPPAMRLTEACEDGIDLLVLGSRGYGPVMRVLLGSVSTQLVRRAPCPVLVVPRPRR
jgi:nucleotide-binding universal stress UspA family protein